MIVITKTFFSFFGNSNPVLSSFYNYLSSFFFDSSDATASSPKPAVPELLENEVGESLNCRTAALIEFKHLGPPDLVHLSKINTKTGAVDSTYHYVSGVDVSSSSAIAAHLNSLASFLGYGQIWFGKVAAWKIQSAIYCCYNPFSRVDTRVLVQFPGSVEAYVVGDQGDKHPASDRIWLETYLSAMLRALLFADDDSYTFISYWTRLNPFESPPSQTAAFFEAFETLFFRGPDLGCDPQVQNPTLVSNYLVDGLVKFVSITGMYDQAVEVLQRLAAIDPAVYAILANIYFLNNEEVKAVKILHKGLSIDPRDSNLLQIQAQHCLRKEKLDWALDCAVRAVHASPSEFLPWALLVQIYTKLGQYEQALLTLNSCPMSTFRQQDLPKLPQPACVHFPLPPDGVLDEVWNAKETDQHNVADPELLNLQAPALQSTFTTAYGLLVDIISNIGWDALLQYRSSVFIMEEEYPKDSKPRARRRGSSESKNTLEPGLQTSQNSQTNPHDSSARLKEPQTTQSSSDSTAVSYTPADKQCLDTPKSKRLCERWLDNLIMVLYEDIRVYTVWRAEYTHCTAHSLPYYKSSLEWELLGMVAARLHHPDEALDAFRQALSFRFSHIALWKILDIYAQSAASTHDARDALLETVVKLTAWNHRWYTDFSVKLGLALRRLVVAHGLLLVSSMVDAKYRAQGVEKLMTKELRILETYHAPGADS